MDRHLSSFNYWIESARVELGSLARFRSPDVRRSVFGMALFYVSHALNAANRMNDRARKRLCLRIMNWIRSDMRREA